MNEQAQKIEDKALDAIARVLILIAKAIASKDKNDNEKKELHKK